MNILWHGSFWAIWPYETMIVSKRNVNKITDFTEAEVADFLFLKQLTTKYDNLSRPLSIFIRNSSVAYRWRIASRMAFSYAFYPPLLRSATVKKFMVATK
jgi:UDPglucose--hexose-1-phosphate uridylyltransferase